MRISGFFAAFFLLTLGYSYGQVNILNAKSPEEIGRKSEALQVFEASTKPLPYGYTDERDILWAKNVWEYIDLNQRVNFPLLFPLDERIAENRRSLYHVLLNAIKNGDIKHIYTDSYFNREQSLSELDATLQYADTLSEGLAQLNAGETLDEQFISHTEVDAADVQGYRIRGYWYFDKRQGDQRYRLIGIAPMVIDAYNKQQGYEDAQPVELFWIFYPEAREVLHKAKVFNPDNTAQPLSFDQVLNGRRFNAVIYKTDNEYGDREIADYIGDNALMQLLESERIKEEIRDFEANMWNY